MQVGTKSSVQRKDGGYVNGKSAALCKTTNTRVTTVGQCEVEFLKVKYNFSGSRPSDCPLKRNLDICAAIRPNNEPENT